MHPAQKVLVVGLAASAIFVGTIGSSACDGSGGEGGSGQDIADVVYAGGATDEALESLLAATPVTDASQAATFTAPSNGATLASEPAPTFTWKVGATPSNAAPPPSPHAFLERSFSDRAASSLAALFLWDVRSAWAHGTPTSGAAYFVVFSTSKEPKLLRVFTTETFYIPASTELAKLKSAGEAIRAIVTHAEFDQNRIATDGGPFAGTEITFTLQ